MLGSHREKTVTTRLSLKLMNSLIYPSLHMKTQSDVFILVTIIAITIK